MKRSEATAPLKSPDDWLQGSLAVQLARRAVARLLASIESRDLRAISAALHSDATWQNVPHAATGGRGAVIEMLAPIITWSDRVR